MRKVTASFAVILILLGVGLYVATGMENVTALIPAFVGVGFAICALLATTPSRNKHAMHAAAVLALVGLGGSVPGIPKALKHLGGEAIERPEAAWGRTVMAILCIVFIVLAIRSFIQARKEREAGEAGADA